MSHYTGSVFSLDSVEEVLLVRVDKSNNSNAVCTKELKWLNPLCML